MKNEYILIRTIDLLEFLKDAEDSFMLSIFKSNLKNNIIDSLPEKSNKMGKNDITNNYIKFKNNDQVKSTIELLREKIYFRSKNSVIFP